MRIAVLAVACAFAIGCGGEFVEESAPELGTATSSITSSGCRCPSVAAPETLDEEETGSSENSLSLVLDESGSMERTYPTEDYGDLCLTCPHDPEKIRALE